VSSKLILNKIVISYLNNVTSSPVNFSKYDNLLYNIEIVDYCDVISSYLCDSR